MLNPVRAAVVSTPAYGCGAVTGHDGNVANSYMLTIDGVLAEFGKRRAGARRKYQQFIEEGKA